jgi:hypothetical protein
VLLPGDQFSRAFPPCGQGAPGNTIAEPKNTVARFEVRMTPASPLSDLGRTLLVIGIVLVVVGTLLLFGARLPFRLGRLPGDIAYQGRNGSFYFPIVTCLLLSAVLTLLFWIVNLFRR